MSVWIDITEYASKYGVSQSTLRRRIRTKTIPYKMEKGKYLLEDTPQTIESAPLYIRMPHQQKAPRHSSLPKSRANPSASLKSDYEAMMKENRKLKEQISELETLVKALEAELGA